MFDNKSSKQMVQDLILFLFNKQAIKMGDFILSSGKKSNFYIDLRILQSHPVFFRMAILLLRNKIEMEIGLENFYYICSIPTSGTVFGSSLAYEIFRPHVYLRKDKKPYGTQKSLEGNLKPNSKVIFIDDVITTGNSIISGINELKSKAEILGIFVLIDRKQGSDNLINSHGTKLHSVTSISEIVNILYKNNKINHTEFMNMQKEME